MILRYYLPILIMMIVFMGAANASESVTVKSCVGTSCHTKTFTVYTRQELSTMQPKMICEVFEKNYRQAGDEIYWVNPVMMFGKDGDCL